MSYKLFTQFERTIILRGLVPGYGQGSIFLISIVSVTAIMLGVAALIVVMSVMNGFHDELFEKSVGLKGHAVIEGKRGRLQEWPAILKDVRKTPGVLKASPLIERPLMAVNNGRVGAIILRGMEPDELLSNRNFVSKVVDGDLRKLDYQKWSDVSALPYGNESNETFAFPKSATQYVAIGSGLANFFGVRVGGQITLINYAGRRTSFGVETVELSYPIGAIFETGDFEIDGNIVIISIEGAQEISSFKNAINRIEILTSNRDKSSETLAPLHGIIGDRGELVDWKEASSSLYEAIALEKIAMAVILMMIVTVAMFNILSALFMLVRIKKRDIAIIRTMGATQKSIVLIYISIGMVMGLVGIFLGVLLGLLVLHFINDLLGFIELIAMSISPSNSFEAFANVPSRMESSEFLGVILITIGATFCATLYPAFVAARVDPVEVLRYE